MKIRSSRSNRIVRGSLRQRVIIIVSLVHSPFSLSLFPSLVPFFTPTPTRARALSFREFLRFLSRGYNTHAYYARVHRFSVPLRQLFNESRSPLDRTYERTFVRSFVQRAVTFTSTLLPTQYSHVAFALDTAEGIVGSSRTEGESLFGTEKTDGRGRHTNDFIVTPLCFVRKRRHERDDRAYSLARSLESISGKDSRTFPSR